MGLAEFFDRRDVEVGDGGGAIGVWLSDEDRGLHEDDEVGAGYSVALTAAGADDEGTEGLRGELFFEGVDDHGEKKALGTRDWALGWEREALGTRD